MRPLPQPRASSPCQCPTCSAPRSPPRLPILSRNEIAGLVLLRKKRREAGGVHRPSVLTSARRGLLQRRRKVLRVVWVRAARRPSRIVRHLPVATAGLHLAARKMSTALRQAPSLGASPLSTSAAYSTHGDALGRCRRRRRRLFEWRRGAATAVAPVLSTEGEQAATATLTIGGGRHQRRLCAAARPVADIVTVRLLPTRLRRPSTTPVGIATTVAGAVAVLLSALVDSPSCTTAPKPAIVAISGWRPPNAVETTAFGGWPSSSTRGLLVV